MRTDRAVLFDLGNVLVHIHPELFATTLGLTEDSRKHYRSAVIEHTKRYEEGGFSTHDYFAELGRILDGRFDRRTLEEALRKVIGRPIEGMAGILRATAEKATVALVSNTNDFHFTYCLKTFDFLDLIPHRFLSYQMKSLKPSPVYYQKVLEELKIPPKSALFIDDMPENIEGAVNAGMTGHVFRGAEGLESIIKNHLSD